MEPKLEKVEENPKENKASSSVFTCSDSALEKHRLKEVLDNIPSAVILLEKPDGLVTYANKRAIELYGVNPCGIAFEKHAKGLKICKVDGKPCPTLELNTYRALFNEETILNAIEIIERRDGKRFTVNVSVKPLYNKEGKADAAIAIFDDVTERAKTQEALKESEERLKMAQQIAHVGSWEYNIKEDKAVWSEELFQIFGLPLQRFGPNTLDYVARFTLMTERS